MIGEKQHSIITLLSFIYRFIITQKVFIQYNIDLNLHPNEPYIQGLASSNTLLALVTRIVNLQIPCPSCCSLSPIVAPVICRTCLIFLFTLYMDPVVQQSIKSHRKRTKQRTDKKVTMVKQITTFQGVSHVDTMNSRIHTKSCHSVGAFATHSPSSWAIFISSWDPSSYVVALSESPIAGSVSNTRALQSDSYPNSHYIGNIWEKRKQTLMFSCLYVSYSLQYTDHQQRILALGTVMSYTQVDMYGLYFELYHSSLEVDVMVQIIGITMKYAQNERNRVSASGSRRTGYQQNDKIINGIEKIRNNRLAFFYKRFSTTTHCARGPPLVYRVSACPQPRSKRRLRHRIIGCQVYRSTGRRSLFKSRCLIRKPFHVGNGK